MKLDFSEFLWDPFYKVRNYIPDLFASAMMSMIVMIRRTEMTLEDLDYEMMLILALIKLVKLMLINSADDDIDSNDRSLSNDDDKDTNDDDDSCCSYHYGLDA